MAETVGSLVDKISIMELKLFNMKAQTLRSDSGPKHKAACHQRWLTLKRQRDDLAMELSRLFKDLASGKTRLKIYRQFKMYNDPSYRSSPSNGRENK